MSLHKQNGNNNNVPLYNEIKAFIFSKILEVKHQQVFPAYWYLCSVMKRTTLVIKHKKVKVITGILHKGMPDVPVGIFFCCNLSD